MYFVRYVLSRSAVDCLSLNERELCPLHPFTLMIPLSESICVLSVVASSIPSKPVSARIVNIVAYLFDDAEIILFMFAVVGINGIFRSCL